MIKKPARWLFNNKIEFLKTYLYKPVSIRVTQNESKKRFPRCPRCRASLIQKFGQTSNQKQRFKCLLCKHTFIWKKSYVKKHNEKVWFKLWVYDNYTVKDLCKLSGYSSFKIRGIIRFWLLQTPELKMNLKTTQYLICDGTYFHKDGCLVLLMNAIDQTISDCFYTLREGSVFVKIWFNDLKMRGLQPLYITMDGEINTMKML